MDLHILLSDTYPICSGKHKLVRDEENGKVYIYDQGGNRLGTISLKNVGKLRRV
ncbi:iron-binding protein [Vulcanisaeta sp. JCM 14467]|uniref:iron-binding protein n=1 Tax=Vulcanisaeta sp. JCM 14467 TaxID=1295370 RepID=UPI000A408DF2|nr:iron-binding protein [Vulcanisaeta sp. JCM 14467]